MRPMTSMSAAAAVALSTAALLWSNAQSAPSRQADMIALSPRLQPVFEKTKTACFGRFVVQLPATATVVYGPAGAPSNIVRYLGEGASLNERVSQKLAQLNSDFEKKLAADVGQSRLYGTAVDGAIPEQKLVFGHTQGLFHEITSFVKIGADLYVQRTPASLHENTDSIAAKFTIADGLADLNTVARHLRPRAEVEIPAERGLCIDGAFIADNPAVTHEQITLSIRLAEFPDVHFSIEVNKNQGRLIDSSALEPPILRAEDLARSAGQWPWRGSISTFRRAPRELGLWQGFEYLVYMPRLEKVGRRHDFAYVALGSPTDPYLPQLTVEMNTGVKGNRTGGVEPSLSNDEAVAVWDALIGSIAVRPTTAATETSEAPLPDVPLGPLAATGRPRSSASKPE